MSDEDGLGWLQSRRASSTLWEKREDEHFQIMDIQSSSQNNDRDDCVDGSIWEDDQNAIAEWLKWFDNLEPVFSGRELEEFDAALAWRG